ncbi:MAG: hypothetical protein ACSHYC_03705 [Alphaproteobacteria bacterium]
MGGEIVGIGLFADQEQGSRKSEDFQVFATRAAGKQARSLMDRKMAATCGVKALDRAESPLCVHFLASHCHLFCYFITHKGSAP